MTTLNLAESLKLAQKYGIKTPAFHTAMTESEALKAAAKTGYPLALKVISSSITHKTEKGGVKINLRNEEELEKAFMELAALEEFEGALVQPMASGTEIIIGGKVDDQFGPTILFGLGGIFVEVLKDYSLRICPITRSDAREMIHEIRGFTVLAGARGKPAANLKEIENALLNTSRLLMKEKQVRELDFNPLMVNEKEAVCVDARIIV
ncbi:MAG: acetate--CoA ligase family protein [Candidatus Diapherotrites archaeon]|nr:acetate--CoA ligase family protein [Candidatus Diapherotrites archaeon]